MIYLNYRGMLTWLNLVQQGDVTVLSRIAGICDMSDNMQVLNMCYLLIQSGKFMEMGCEEAKRVYLGSNMPVSCMSTACRTDLDHD